MSDKRILWITWERHRRTRELAGALDARLLELIYDGPYIPRALWLSLRTLVSLLRHRPSTLMVQNPSLVLTTLVCLLKGLFGYRLIVDRHSNFKLHTLASRSLKYRIFHVLSRYTLRAADLTIVTNQPLRDLLEDWGGTGFVLPDRFPDLPKAKARDLGSGHHILYICSFSADEPVADVLDAARALGAGYTVHITGNQAKAAAGLVDSAPGNVEFTGFLPEDGYQSLLTSCDVVLTLTTIPNIMQCGAYEAVAAGKPLVMGKDKAMSDWFFKGRVTTEINGSAIAEAIGIAVGDREKLQNETSALRIERGRDWELLYTELLTRPEFASQRR